MMPFGNDAALLEFWRGVIDPDGVGMAVAVARDISEYRGEPIDYVLARMERGKDDFKVLWERTAVNRIDVPALTKFYSSQFVEAYELANWHSGKTNGVPPLHYARAAAVAQQMGLRRVLDFGSGIGSGSLALATAGCTVHSADIATELLAFTSFRMRRRAFVPVPIDLAAGETPPEHFYDLITCFDVLEHVPDQLAKLNELSRYVRSGGYLIVNLMEDSYHPDRPMHISSAGDWLKLVRRSRWTPDWTFFETGEIQIVRKVRFGSLRNVVAAYVDARQRRKGTLWQQDVSMRR